MAKKTYRTYFLKNLVLHLKDKKGKRVEVAFHGGLQIDSTAKYTTSDAGIQKLVEATALFGRDFYIESVVDDAPAEVEEEKVVASSPEPEKPLVDMKDSRRFRNLVEMKNAMAEAGLEVKMNWSYTAAKNAAIAAGYDYQIEK